MTKCDITRATLDLQCYIKEDGETRGLPTFAALEFKGNMTDYGKTQKKRQRHEQYYGRCTTTFPGTRL